jgi:arylsulfatase A-like enzyme
MAVLSVQVGLMDQVIGNITGQLQARGMWNNTLVVFASDNGAPLDLNEAGSSNTPLRGGKYASWEGGIRTPAFVSGGYVPQELRGTSQDGVVHIADWYATFCGIGGVDPSDPVAKIAGLPPIDSVDVWPLISGANATWPRVEIPVSPQALISWPYKLITGENAFASWQGDEFPNSSSTEDSVNPMYNCSNGCLFDLSQDSNEHTDISANNPSIVQSLNNRLNALVPGFFSNNDTGVDACPSNITLLCGCWMATHYWGNFLGPFQL